MSTHQKHIYIYVATHLFMLLGWGNLLLIGISVTDTPLITTMALLSGGALAAAQICALVFDFRQTAHGLDDPETRW
jgi:hypothetical protein